MQTFFSPKSKLCLLYYIYYFFSALTDALSAKGSIQQPICKPVSTHLGHPVDSTQITFEEKLELISSARSIDGMLKWTHYLVKTDAGIVCTTCGTMLQYDFKIGECFTDIVMPDTFQHLKYGVKRHINSDSHKENVKLYEKNQLAEELSCAEGKVNALNCASAAYLTYKLNNSYQSYESLVTELHNSGSSVGVYNHSKEFCRLFLPHVHAV